MSMVARIEALFDRWGRRLCVEGPQGTLTMLEHLLQCADVAQSSGADDALVAAALLHDIGHLLGAGWDADDDDHLHPELAAVRFLGRDFGPEVLEPIRLQACAWHRPPGGEHSVDKVDGQGFAMTAPSCSETDWFLSHRRFESSAYGERAALLYQFDRQALVPGKPTPGLGHFLGLLERLVDCRGPQQLCIAATQQILSR